MDISKSGELAKELFQSAFRRMGIDLQDEEINLFESALDKKGIIYALLGKPSCPNGTLPQAISSE